MKTWLWDSNAAFTEVLDFFKAEPLASAPSKDSPRLFSLKHSFRAKLRDVFGGGAATRSYDYNQKYDPDPYGHELADESLFYKVYNDEADLYDNERLATWKDALDVLLVFVRVHPLRVKS